MEEDKKRQIATFRFGVISDFVVSHELARASERGFSQRRPIASGRFLFPVERDSHDPPFSLDPAL